MLDFQEEQEEDDDKEVTFTYPTRGKIGCVPVELQGIRSELVNHLPTEVKETRSLLQEHAKQWNVGNFDDPYTKKEERLWVCFVMYLIDEGILCRV
jgi:hypothetical protein